MSLASCSQDEPAEQGTTLPDGMYPMTFTVVQAAPESTPQTRVTESGDGMSSQWTNDDRIKITVSGPGNNMEAEMLRINGVFVPDKRLYWQNTNDATVNAWYSNIEGKGTMPSDYAVSLADQSSGLAYVLKTDPVTANYQTGDIVLNFYHQLAKIRVKLDKGSYQGDLSNVTVKVKGYTSCIVKNGEVSEGSGEGYTTMHKNGEYYEANLVPGTLQASEAFEISAGNKSTKVSLKNDISLEKGNVHAVTITVKQKVTEIDLSTLKSPYTIDKEGKYILTGSTTQRITINANATVILKGVTIDQTNGDGAPIRISGNHTATLMLEDNNTLTSKQPYSAILPDKGSTVVIDGTGSLTAKGGYRTAGIGAGDYNSADIVTGDYYGAGIIRILGGTIEASSGGSGTGIGSAFFGACQGVEILGGTITARAGSGFTTPAIGSFTASSYGTCEYVKLERCTIHAYSAFSYETEPVVANSVTPDINNSDALATAYVTLNVY